MTGRVPAEEKASRSRRVVVVDDGSLTMSGAQQALAGPRVDCTVDVVPDVATALVPGRCAPGTTVLLLSEAAVPVLRQYGGPEEVTVRFRVLLLCEKLHPAQLGGWLRDGVRGCITRQTSGHALIAAVHTLAEGGFFFPAESEQALTTFASAQAETAPSRPPTTPMPITARETEVLRLIASGLTHKQAGNRLGLSKTTVDTYVQRMRQKLQVGNKADLTRVAAECGLTLAAVPERRAAGLSQRQAG